MAANGLQAWEVADASEPSTFGKVKLFRENEVPATENSAFLMCAVVGSFNNKAFCKPLWLKSIKK